MNKEYPIVSAAMLMQDGLIVPGVRHFSSEMRLVLERIYGPLYHHYVLEQGFVDNHSNFLSRKEALERAIKISQVSSDAGRGGELFSEDLY